MRGGHVERLLDECGRVGRPSAHRRTLGLAYARYAPHKPFHVAEKKTVVKRQYQFSDAIAAPEHARKPRGIFLAGRP